MLSPVIKTMALAALGAGCAHGGGVEVHNRSDPPATDSVYVQVINDNFNDARVHAVYDGGGRVSLGTISGKDERPERAIPWQPRPLVFEITFIVSGDRYLSVPVDLARGDFVQVRLPPNIESSGFFRRISR